MSGEATVLGIDVGLSGTRAAVLSVGGRVMGRGRCAENRGDAGQQVRPRVWVDEVMKAARSALAEANVRSVDAIGIGAFGPVSVLLDEELNPLAVGPLFPADPAMEIRLLADRDPDALARAAWLVDACGYLVSTLVGKPVLDRISAADQSLPQDWHSVGMPQVQEPFALAGGLTTEAASQLGLVWNTPVTVGTYDTFVDLAALGVERPGDRGVLLGSTLIVGAVCEGDDAPQGLRASRHAGDGWFVGGWTQSAGRSLAWWLGLFEPGRRVEMKRDALAMPPGDAGLLALPYLDGERAPVWDPHARGAFIGITTATTAAELYRAMVDAVALSAADLAERVRTVTVPTGEVRPWLVAGGGVHDEVWLRATVDAIGEPMEAADLSGGIGAARTAFRVLDEQAAALPTRRYEPDPSRHARFVRLLPSYRALYGALSPTLGVLRAPAPTEGT